MVVEGWIVRGRIQARIHGRQVDGSLLSLEFNDDGENDSKNVINQSQMRRIKLEIGSLLTSNPRCCE